MAEHFGKRIERRREQLGLSRKELGQACETTEQGVGAWEIGKAADISGRRLAQVARKLKCSMDYLMTGKGAPADRLSDDAPTRSGKQLSEGAAWMGRVFETLSSTVPNFSDMKACFHFESLLSLLCATSLPAPGGPPRLPPIPRGRGPPAS